MFGGYWVVYENTTVDEVAQFLNSVDYDVAEFCNWLANKFNRCYHRTFANHFDFDTVSVHLAILGFKNKNSSLNDKRIILHFLIYHHFMLINHTILKDPEIKLMRAKIAKNAGINIDEYLQGYSYDQV